MKDKSQVIDKAAGVKYIPFPAVKKISSEMGVGQSHSRFFQGGVQ